MINDKERECNLICDNLIEKIKRWYEQIKVIDEIEQDKINEIKALAKFRREKITGKIKNALAELMTQSSGMTQSETKTQKKIKLLSGDIVIKKASKVMKVEDKEAVVNWVKDNSLETQYIKTEQVEKLSWASLKADLEIVDDCVVHKGTGLVIENVLIEQKEEEVIIK